MKLNAKVCTFLAIGLLSAMVSSTASATTIALSENDSANGLIKSPSGLDAAFTGLGAGDMVVSATQDAHIAKPGASASQLNANTNSDHIGGNGNAHSLIKFDLSAIPAGSIINKAQLQFWGHTGNQPIGNSTFGTIATHDWSEGVVTANSPIGTPDTPEWGAGSNAVFDFGAGNAVPVSTAIDVRTNFINDNPGFSFTYFMIEDVTASLQSFVDGSASNYGWGFNGLNYVVSSSENNETVNIGPNAGANTRPVLFVDYEAIPEPSTFLMLAVGLSLVGSQARRKV